MIYLLRGTFVRVIAEIRRYLLNLISSIVIFLIIFILIVTGFKMFGQQGTSTFTNTAIGYFTWMAVMFNLTDLSWTIMGEMQRGIIEQVFTSPFGPIAAYTVYEFFNMLISFPLIYGMMILIFSIAGMNILVPPSFFLYLVLAMLQSMGIGYVLAGITLRYKRTQALLNLAQFAIIGALFLDPSKWWSFLLPVASQFEAMKLAFNGKAVPLDLALKSLAGTAVYLTVGVMVFGYFIRSVKKRGDLSMY